MRKRYSAYNILITAGPTREFIDPVRFISNPSTGIIGYLIAAYARKRRHKVILLSGATHHKPLPGVKTLFFTSALDLKKLAGKYASWADCIICAAAVGDFRPRRKVPYKIKKQNGFFNLLLEKNPDILEGLGKKKNNQILIGFALETGDMVQNGLKKLKDKNLDCIVVNELSAKSNPFGQGLFNTFIIYILKSACTASSNNKI